MRHILLTAIVLLASAVPLFAEPPKATIVGPTGGVPGDILLLDAGQSKDAEHYDWRVYPELPNDRPTILVLEGGQQAIVASVPGTYIVFLAVSNGDGIDMLRWAVHVSGTPPGPTPPPGPEPGPGPEPEPGPNLSGIAKQVYDAVKGFEDTRTASALAGNFNSMSSAIAAGAYKGDLLVAKAKIINDLKASNNESVDGGEWDTFLRRDLSRWLNEKDDAGEMDTLPQIGKVFKDIAKGLEAAAD